MTEWIRIGDEENDAPWCRELDGGEGVQIAADADTERERAIGLLYSELDAIPHVAAYVARIAELDRAARDLLNALHRAGVPCPACGGSHCVHMPACPLFLLLLGGGR